jgi:hypothetical protein
MTGTLVKALSMTVMSLAASLIGNERVVLRHALQSSKVKIFL